MKRKPIDPEASAPSWLDLYPEESFPPKPRLLPFDALKFSQAQAEALTLLHRGVRPRDAYAKVKEFLATHEMS